MASTRFGRIVLPRLNPRSRYKRDEQQSGIIGNVQICLASCVGGNLTLVSASGESILSPLGPYMEDL
jgi:hypothetical protein